MHSSPSAWCCHTSSVRTWLVLNSLCWPQLRLPAANLLSKKFPRLIGVEEPICMMPNASGQTSSQLTALPSYSVASASSRSMRRPQADYHISTVFSRRVGNFLNEAEQPEEVANACHAIARPVRRLPAARMLLAVAQLFVYSPC